MSPRKLRLLAESLRGWMSADEKRQWANELDAYAKQIERRDEYTHPILNNSEQPLGQNPGKTGAGGGI